LSSTRTVRCATARVPAFPQLSGKGDGNPLRRPGSENVD
jgi:hypothetical protein